MLDLIGILFSSVMMLFVIVRALQLDRVQPWFQTVRRQQVSTPAAEAPWRRRLQSGGSEDRHTVDDLRSGLWNHETH
jgi:hypothetical protein